MRIDEVRVHYFAPTISLLPLGRSFRKHSRAAMILGTLAMMAGSGNVALAQRFEGYQSTQSIIGTQNLYHPAQIAVDGSGNIYIADAGQNQIVEEAPVAGGYIESTVTSTNLDGPMGVAVDGNGNIYIADSGNGRVLKEMPSGGSYVESIVMPDAPTRDPVNLAVDKNGVVYIADSSSGSIWIETPNGSGGYVETSILWTAYGMGSPQAVAVDGDADVFVASTGTAAILKGIPSGSSYTVTPVSYVSLGTSFSPAGIAVDSNGNLFVSDDGAHRVVEESPVGSSYQQTTVDRNLGVPVGVAVDSNGFLYIGEYKNNLLVQDTLFHGSFGAVNVATSSLPMTLIFSFDSNPPGSLGTPAVLTQGLTQQDFADAGTGTCTLNGPSHIYSDGQTCTVDVVFTPKYVGARYGAVVLDDSSGNTIATAYVQGIGVGPQMSFPPGLLGQLSLASLNSPYAIATDGGGNLYIAEAVSANSPANAVIKETWSGSGYTPSTVATGLAYPVGVAVDGVGNVFVADQGATSIIEASPSPGGYMVNTILSALGSVEGVAVDGHGNLYIASDAYGVLKETYSSLPLGYTPTTIAASIFAQGIAVDGQGNVYLSNAGAGQIDLEMSSNGGYTQTAIGSNLSPLGIVVDPNGNIYVAEHMGVAKETFSGERYTQSTFADTVLAVGVGLDGGGNLYITSGQGNSVSEANFADPPSLSFAASTVGQTSIDSPQSITIENSGNATLSLPVPDQGTNPSIPGGFVANSAVTSACPFVEAGASNPGLLLPGDMCDLSVSFSPIVPGADNSTLVFTYAASSGNATRTIALNGTASKGTPTESLIASPNPALASNPVTFSAALSAGAITPTGTVSFYDGSTLLGQGTLSGGITTYSTGLAAGPHSITAVYSGDTNFTAVTSAVVVETIEKGTPAESLTSSSNPAFALNPVTFSATLSTAIAPTGTVSFYDGNTLLGQGALTGGVTTYSTSGLAAGPHSITAVYSGDSNLAGVTSGPVVETIEDFTISAQGALSATGSPGGKAVFTFGLAPLQGTAFPAAISLTATGLTTGATATFSPATIKAGSGSTNVTLTVAIPSQATAQLFERPLLRGTLAMGFGVVLLPFAAGWRRRSHRRRWRGHFSVFVAMVWLAALAGCGSSSTMTQTQPQSYKLTITATSGRLSHTIGGVLTVE